MIYHHIYWSSLSCLYRALIKTLHVQFRVWMTNCELTVNCELLESPDVEGDINVMLMCLRPLDESTNANGIVE